ncbi:YqaJ viral recombinase family protein [Serratia symbiotica]|uniref:YqaJ viral recombinase family protein n=1 Tax=Serratia symbiotica TaxID=138074 RepID=UPI00268F2BE2
MEQQSPEWFAARCGKVTASRLADVMARTKSGYSASRQNYMAELICQRLTGTREEGYSNSAMRRGNELEPECMCLMCLTNSMLRSLKWALYPTLLSKDLAQARMGW